MNIHELSNLTGNVSVSVTLGDLREFFSEMIAEAAASKERVETEEKFLSVDEVAKELRVSKPTLWRWGKIGYLKPKRIGRKVVYSQRDIENLRNQ